ncbi:hypothetical protein OPQ81_006787 [Rhizoctonia solani]|nr:hypothetical protein OPQ81_006787 [Rhizoctonia solani]
MDTVKASTNLQALREPCDSRDSFMYNPHDKPREVLKLKHIAEMCRYFTGHSIEYSLLGANCRWICYALLECLRESQPCYGGTWLPSRNERPTADVRAAQLAKSHYLQDKHPTCCGRQYLVCPNLGAQITRATVGLASIAVTGSSQNTRNRGSQYAADQGVIYRTPRSLPESAVPRQGTSVLTTNANANAGRNFSTATSPQPVSPNGTSSNNTTSSNTPELSLRAGAAQSNRHQDNVSPLPAGANITQYSEALSESTYENTPSDSQTQRHTTTPHIQHNVSQLGGTFSTPHCSGCQCTGHSGQHQNVSNDRRPDPARSKPPLIDSRGDGIHDLTSQFSSMSVQSSVSVRGTSHGQRVGGMLAQQGSPSRSQRSINAQAVVLKGAHTPKH